MKKIRITRGKIPSFWNKWFRIMKLTLLFLTIGLLQVSASVYSQATKLTLNLRDAKVVEILDAIENQSEFRFAYSPGYIDLERKLSLEVKDKTLEQCLQIIFNGTDVEYAIRDRHILLFPGAMDKGSGGVVAFSNYNNSQQRMVSGKVTDSAGQPLPGVSIVLKGTTQGTVTDANGNYTLSNLPDDAVLVLSFVGMRTQEMVVGNQTTINIIMEEETIGIEEVVAIGYGTQSRRQVTASISSVKADKIEDIPVNDVISAVQGKVAGVNIYNSNFAPGDTPDIRIRGGSSIQKSNSPLIIVDGIPRTFEDINPNDIASLDVLKDASATAIYGARASNGVVLITTKRGQKNKAPEITFQSDLSLLSTHGYHPLVNGEEFINLIRTNAVGSPFEYSLYQDGPASHVNNENSVFTPRWLEDGETIPEGWNSMPDPIYNGKTIIFQENDPVDYLFKTGFVQNYHIGISGGTDNLRYSGGIGYTDNDGTVIDTRWKRLSGFSNVDIEINRKLYFSSGVDYTYTENETEPSWANAVYRQLIMAPTWRMYYADGSPVPGFNASATPPPFWRATRDYFEYKNKLGLNAILKYKPIEELTIAGNAFYYRSEFEDEYFEKSHFFAQNRNAYVNQDVTQTKQFETTATYIKTVAEDHNFTLMAGVSDLFIASRNLDLSADGAATDNIPTLNAAPNKKNASSSKSEESLLGMFSRLSYDYGNKYLFQATMRRDGSSRFGKGNKWAYFPSFSVGWIVSDEPFMDGISIINNLKLRSSYGFTGNNAVGLYTAQGTYSIIKYGGMSGIYSTAMPNQNLRWEKTKQIDVGFDLSILNDKITLYADYYTKITDDLLFSQPLPNTSGFTSIETNIGSVKFYGVDLDLNVNILKSGDFSWDGNFIYSLNKNVVLKLPDNDRDKNRVGGYVVPDGEDFGGIAEGESLYSILGYKVDFIIDNQQQADNAHFDQLARGISLDDGTTVPGRKFSGDYEWVDRNGDNKIDEYDQFVLGYTMPHTTGGIGTTLAWKGLTLHVFMDYALGHSQMDQFWMHTNNNAFLARTRPTKYVLTDSWEEEGDAATKTLPKFYVQDQGMQSNYYRPSDARLWKLDNICLREVKLSYNIPNNILGITGFNKVNVYIAGNTLKYFTKEPKAMGGGNPEVGSESFYGAGFGYPSNRKVTFGFNITL